MGDITHDAKGPVTTQGTLLLSICNREGARECSLRAPGDQLCGATQPVCCCRRGLRWNPVAACALLMSKAIRMASLCGELWPAGPGGTCPQWLALLMPLLPLSTGRCGYHLAPLYRWKD